MFFKKTLFIFHRDLRLDDNTGLLQALAKSEHVIPCFIFNPQQVSTKNEYRSKNCIQFMIESIIDLDAQLKKKHAKLYLFYGTSTDIIKKLIKEEKIDAVFCNRDYTPFSIKRDEALKQLCLKAHIAFEQYGDALLNEPEEIKSGNGTPYAVYTAFFKECFKHYPVRKPIKCTAKNFYTKKIDLEESSNIYKKILPSSNSAIKVQGGRTHALKVIKKMNQFSDYDKKRNFPALDATTHLSAHNKFGTVSIREVYHAIADSLSRSHTLIKELYWRDFFTHVAYHSPFVFGHAYHKKYDNLWWENDTKKFKAWCEGTTGFPFVDAGMRELNKTGYMHNRVRMIVASFLTKDLHIDWRWGEKYFAQQLVDYDPAVNNGNWQWAASTGCDAQPYFRIFNPWLQQKKFDTECLYIKKWVHELKKVEPKIIHAWFKEKSPRIKGYPRPIVEHEKEARIAKKIYKKK